MNGRDWLGRQVRVFAAYDWRKEHGAIDTGEVIAYIDGPSVIVRQSDGSDRAWPVSLPIEKDDDPADRRICRAVNPETGRSCVLAWPHQTEHQVADGRWFGGAA